jgi:hypothetical protein
MSKPLLNDPFALLSNKASVQGTPFDAGSLGRLPIVPSGRSPSGSAHECKFSKINQVIFRFINRAVDPSTI